MKVKLTREKFNYTEEATGLFWFLYASEEISGVYLIVDIEFSESVTVKGNPQLKVSAGDLITKYASGSGSSTLRFEQPKGNRGDAAEMDVAGIDLNSGAIIASEAGSKIRAASIELPKSSK